MSVPTDELTAFRIGELEKDVVALTRKVDRLMWAILTLTITIAGSSVVFAITAASLR